jgi:hypothetical protein
VDHEGGAPGQRLLFAVLRMLDGEGVNIAQGGILFRIVGEERAGLLGYRGEGRGEGKGREL